LFFSKNVLSKRFQLKRKTIKKNGKREKRYAASMRGSSWVEGVFKMRGSISLTFSG
jgi:hypothetical protein